MMGIATLGRMGGGPFHPSAANSLRQPWFRWFAAGILAALALSLSLLVTAILRLSGEAVLAEQRVERTLGALVESSNLLSAIQDSETGQRGFLLTLDPAYLRPYEVGRDAARERLARLHDLTWDDPWQQHQLPTLDATLAAKLTELATTVELAQAGDLAGAMAVVRTDAGRLQMQEIRRLLQELEERGEEMLVARRAEAAEAGQRVQRNLSLAAVLAITTTLAGFASMVALGWRQRAAERALMLAAGAAKVRAALESTTDGVFVVGPDWRFAFLNRQAVAQIAGGRDLTGKLLWEVFPEALGGALSQAYRRCMAQRVPAEAEQFYAPLGRRFAARAFPAEDGGITVFFRDVTEERASAERQAVLLEIAQGMLEGEHDEASITALVFEKAAPHLGADLCFNYALREGDDSLRLVAAPGVAAGSLEPLRTLRLGEAFCGAVAETRTPLLADATMMAQDERGSLVRGLGVRSYSCHPLFGAEGKLLGTLSFGSTRRDQLSAAEIAFLQTLSHVVALSWQRRHAEEALRDSEAFLRSVLDASTDCVKVVNAEGRLEFMNANGQCLMEIEDFTPLRGQEWAELWPVPGQAALRHALATALSGKPVHFEAFCPTAKGTPKWWDVAVAPVRDAAGRVVRLVSASRDITDRKAAEAALAASEARFRALAEATPSLLFEADAAGRNIYVNARLVEFVGLPAAELRDDGWLRILHPDDRQRGAAAWMAAVRSGSPYEVEFSFRLHDGVFRWFLVRGMPVRDAEGAIQRWVGVCMDIDDHKRAQGVLAREAEQLERLAEDRARVLAEAEARLAQAAKMEALGRLAGGIAHDFNNVLQAVQGGLALATKRLSQDPEDARHYMRLVTEAAARGAAVTGRLLSFARRGELRAETVAPAPLLSGLADMLRSALGPNIALHVEAAPDLPPLLADRGQLEAVLVNLANNARDAMPGGGSLSLCAELATVPGAAGAPEDLAAGGYLRLSVVDAGQGMEAGVLARVTEPFFTTKPKGRGTGLGLAMARGFAEQSGGAMTIDSTPGRGTTVSLWLPRAPLDSAPAQPQAAHHPAASAEEVARSEQAILLVEDEPEVRAVLAAALADQGCEVREAENAAAALALIEDGFRPDAVVTDLAMPGGLDGLDLIREVRRRLPKLPAVLVTGHAGEADPAKLVEAERRGPFALLRKPAAPEVLLERLARVLRRGETSMAGN